MSTGLKVGLDDIRGLFQHECFYNSVKIISAWGKKDYEE